ncbi:hypothetical protein, partial [Klebsiella pneumoniae]|uniref:hypothetical protein n=1 Tax=Klebsiella pneumoniae TaxID=573 RepID=UPI00273131D4
FQPQTTTIKISKKKKLFLYLLTSSYPSTSFQNLTKTPKTTIPYFSQINHKKKTSSKTQNAKKLKKSPLKPKTQKTNNYHT